MTDVGKILHGSSGKKWHVLKYLGGGSCCNVYSVSLEDNIQSAKAAVKIYKEGEKYSSAGFREKELLFLVNKSRGVSPYIVELYDCFSCDGHWCLVEELLDYDLNRLSRIRVLSIQDIYCLSRDISRGLHELHSCGFTHGDLKPTNIMWSSKSQTYKLIDFSLSFHSQDKHVPVIQSRPYRAPEVEEWNDHVTALQSSSPHEYVDKSPKKGLTKPGPSCDIWSLGCIIKNLLENLGT